jgi:hypothetical protein
MNRISIIFVYSVVFLTLFFGIISFATGFFPRKVPLPGYANIEDCPIDFEVLIYIFFCLKTKNNTNQNNTNNFNRKMNKGQQNQYLIE